MAITPAAFDAVLNEIENYLTDRSDVVDGSYGRPAPNDEMVLLMELRQVREIQGKTPAIAERMVSLSDRREKEVAVQELRNIVNAPRFDRDVFTNDTEFADWAVSRARHALKGCG